MRFRAVLSFLALTLLLGLAPGAAARPLGSRQLVVAVDQTAATLNGDIVRLSLAPRLLKGRTMLPLRESAALLDLPLDVQGNVVRVGRLGVDGRTGEAVLDATPQTDDTAAVVNGQIYVSAKVLADVVGANIGFSDDGRSVILTVLRLPDANPLAPQARFSTDKSVYAPGERVVYTEYAFDPEGSSLVSRRWTNRQDAFFQPGTYTVGLQVTNARGATSVPFTRTIRVQGDPIDTPVTFALKYGGLGDTFTDREVLNYPAVTPYGLSAPVFPLLFSDSPEAPDQNGVLYRDVVAGRARLLAYHINAGKNPARLYVLARNVDSRPVTVRTVRLGETAPTRVESVLGQVALMQYFAAEDDEALTLDPGQTGAVYASPALSTGSGANVIADVETTGRVELAFVMLDAALAPSPEVVQALPVLPPDGKHQRGSFPGAVRKLRVNLTKFPSRLVIGDGNFDPPLLGVDVLTNTPQKLMGNYGVLYDLEVQGAAGATVALAARGGLYRGAMRLAEANDTQTLKLPREGVLSKSDTPALLWRAAADRLDIQFIPASGSHLPVSFLFYRLDGPEAQKKNVTP